MGSGISELFLVVSFLFQCLIASSYLHNSSLYCHREHGPVINTSLGFGIYLYFFVRFKAFVGLVYADVLHMHMKSYSLGSYVCTNTHLVVA